MRLRDAKMLGGMAEMQMLGERDERSDALKSIAALLPERRGFSRPADTLFILVDTTQTKLCLLGCPVERREIQSSEAVSASATENGGCSSRANAAFSKINKHRQPSEKPDDASSLNPRRETTCQRTSTDEKRIGIGLGGLGFAALTSSGVNAQGETTLTFWTVRHNTPELSATMRKILDEFEKENPTIKILHEPVSGNLVYPKFLAAVQGQSMPDVAEAYTYHPLQFAALDQMEPMDDIMDEWKASGRYDEVTNKYAIEKNFWNGHYWAVAYNMDIRPVYYRRDLLEAKGIAPPKTWDEFQAAAHRAERSGERGLRRRLSGRRLPHRPALLHGLHVPGRRRHPRQGRQADLRHRRRVTPTSRRSPT